MRAFTSRSGCLLAAARRSGGWQCTDNEVKARLSTSALKHGVSHTALVVAAIRAREKRLFFDPYARLLCGDEGEQLLEEFLSMPKDNFFLTAEKQREMFKLGVAIRHNFFDEFIISALRESQVLSGRGLVRVAGDPGGSDGLPGLPCWWWWWGRGTQEARRRRRGATAVRQRGER